MPSRLASRVDPLLAYATTFLLGLGCALALQGRSLPFSIPVLQPASDGVRPSAMSFDWLWQPYLLLPVAAMAIACGVALLWRPEPLAAHDPALPSVAEKPFESASVQAHPSCTKGTCDAQVEQQLADLIEMVTTYLGGNDKHFASLAHVETRLANATSIDQVRLVVEHLIVLNAAAQDNARALKLSLDEAVSNTNNLSARLSQAEALATFDELTSVANRRKFLDVLDHEVAKSHVDSLPLCVVMADLDFFKNINDTLGHPAGDGVIRDFAKLLAANLRPSDLVARYGGEEFALILPKTSLGTAVDLVERMRIRLMSAKFVDAATARVIGNVTASFGIAAIQDDEVASELVHRADRMLYRAKANGRNRTEVDGFAQA